MQIETYKREQQRERNGCRYNQPCTKIVEKKYQDYDDQQHAAQQVSFHRLRRQLDQIAAVVERDNFDILGQDFIVEFLGLRLNPLQDVLGFFARAQQDDTLHGVVLLLVAEFTQARGDADGDAADVPHQHRGAVMHRQHHVADVLHGDQASHAAHVIELAALRIESAAGVGIVGREGALHLLHRQADRRNPDRIEQYLILHGAAAKPRIIRHSGNGLVLGFDGPVLEGFELHR